MIDRQFPLSQVADAHEYLERGHATGKVVLTHHSNREGSDAAISLVYGLEGLLNLRGDK